MDPRRCGHARMARTDYPMRRLQTGEASSYRKPRALAHHSMHEPRSSTAMQHDTREPTQDERSARRPIAILSYHQTTRPPRRGTPVRSLVLPPRRLRQAAVVAAPARLARPVDARTRALPVGEKTGKVFGITLDDGYLNNYEEALPVLREVGFTATAYIVSAQIGGSNVWDHAKGAPPARLMDAGHLRAWLAAGMDIGAHTRNHVNLCELRRGHRARGNRRQQARPGAGAGRRDPQLLLSLRRAPRRTRADGPRSRLRDGHHHRQLARPAGGRPGLPAAHLGPPAGPPAPLAGPGHHRLRGLAHGPAEEPLAAHFALVPAPRPACRRSAPARPLPDSARRRGLALSAGCISRRSAPV